MLFKLFYSLAIFALLSDAAKILVYNPAFSQSHVRFMGNIADILARDGHAVTVLTPHPVCTIKPYGCDEPSVKNIIVEFCEEVGNNFLQDMQHSIANVWYRDLSDFSIKPDSFAQYNKMNLDTYSRLLKNGKLIQELKDEKFDLAIHEFFDAGSAALMEIFGINQSILATAVGDIGYVYDITGLPNMMTFIPLWITNFGDKMNFWDRFYNIKANFVMNRLNAQMESDSLKLFSKYKKDIAHPKELLMKKTSFILSNVNTFTQSPRPTSNMIQPIGGMHVYPPKPVDEKLNDILNLRKNNVLFSLGSFVKMCKVPLYIKQTLAEAFASMPNTTFLFKYEECSGDNFDFSRYPNIYSQKWLPQSDLLADDRVNLFITHGGMNSIIEGQIRGKPMITIPIFADQVINSQNAFRYGSTIFMKPNEVNKEKLVKSIEAILNKNNNYMENASSIKKMLEGQPEEFRKKLARWVNLQIEHGKPFEHLPLQSRNMSYISLYGVDIMMMLLCFASISIYIAYKILQFILATKISISLLKIKKIE